jgi:hypothetical protein
MVSGVSDAATDGSRLSRTELDGKSVIEGNAEGVSRVASAYVGVGVRASDWTSVLGALTRISVGWASGSVMIEDTSSRTELLTEGWKGLVGTSGVEGPVGTSGVEGSVWIADSGAPVSNREVGTVWLAEEISVVSPSRMSEVDISMLDGSPIAVAVVNAGTSTEGITLL